MLGYWNSEICDEESSLFAGGSNELRFSLVRLDCRLIFMSIYAKFLRIDRVTRVKEGLDGSDGICKRLRNAIRRP